VSDLLKEPPAVPPRCSSALSAETVGGVPRAVLYSTSARLGGSGLDLSSLQGATAAWRAGCLGRAIAYANQQTEIPAARVRSLHAHPVRLLSGLGSERYYGAKKRYLDWITSRELATGAYDLLHSWSGDALRSLFVARQGGVPSVIDIPTWHRNKGSQKPFETKSERDLRAASGWRARLDRLPPSRQHVLLEYALATQLFMPSRFAEQTFLAAGHAPEQLHYVARGADMERFHPAERPPERFRAVFAGALIERKGVHHLLRAWHQLGLKDAELVLIGHVHPEIAPVLRECGGPSVRVVGFSSAIQDHFRAASVFVFPSECEGFAKVTLEAAACGLPLITTAESGDALVEGVTGYRIPPNDVPALAASLQRAYDDRDALLRLGQNARRHVEENFTWAHYHARILSGYARAHRLYSR
jgi:glycosyltransferase involved in cell wall biosynthesis